ncbi:2-polyprenyl-6-methoxyphenol hydroxylase [Bisporella sp. PMI_857]|nr:2-polyprenyl-6-methoxyphenol hydroxylase [Bisporella sp. PMI_857]
MKVIIVGAGIAGLSAAIGLRRAGHEVIIYEKSVMKSEVGAAIHIQPNASRVLQRWEFDVERARLVEARRGIFAKGDTLSTFSELGYEDLEKRYGAKFYYAHRVDLHAELKLLATQEEGGGKPARIESGRRATNYVAENGWVEFADGPVESADLVVAADGLHSLAVKVVTGLDNPAVSTGMSAFRWLAPTTDFLDDPEIAALMDNHEGLARYYVDGPGKRRLVWYPCRENKVQNMALLVPDAELELKSEEVWDFSVDAKDVLDQMEHFHSSLKAIARKAKEVKLYSLGFRAPLPRWHKDRLVVIGDAAHPMLPFQGQAGAQAIEDGAALGVVFSGADPTEANIISEQLESFERIRRNRASVIQMLSNAGQDEAEKVREAVLPYMSDTSKIPTNPKEYEIHNFSYDVFSACQMEMAKV